jgi:hypothetical protein
MMKTVQQKRCKEGWPTALEDAKRKYAEGRAFVSRMREAIRIIERQIAEGEEFPGKNFVISPNYLDIC